MLIPLAAGAIFKIYDDIHDTEMDVSNETMELVQVLLVCIITIFLMKDIGVSTLFIVISIACIFANQVDSSFWKSCLIIPFLTTLANAHLFEFVGIFDLIQRVTLFIMTPLIILGEDTLFPEDFSQRKYLFRIGVVAFCLFVCMLVNGLSAAPFITSSMLFVIGYCLTSLVNNMHRLYESTYDI
jgi:hypothetical protein